MIFFCILLIIWDVVWLGVSIAQHSWLSLLWIALLAWAFFLLFRLVNLR